MVNDQGNLNLRPTTGNGRSSGEVNAISHCTHFGMYGVPCRRAVSVVSFTRAACRTEAGRTEREARHQVTRRRRGRAGMGGHHPSAEDRGSGGSHTPTLRPGNLFD